MLNRLVLVLGCLWLVLADAKGMERSFDASRDTPDYANETVFAYDGRPVPEQSAVETGVQYRRRCFVMVKGVLQFWKFAEFRPNEPVITPDDYHQRVKEISRIPAWSNRDGKVVIPGFSDLREFSKVHGALLRAEMGGWVPTYTRLGNMRVMAPSFPDGRRACAAWLAERVADGEPCGVFVSRLPGMIHAVILYRVQKLPAGDYRFMVYDPNLPAATNTLSFSNDSAKFSFDPTFYFSGGDVNVQRIYISPVH